MLSHFTIRTHKIYIFFSGQDMAIVAARIEPCVKVTSQIKKKHSDPHSLMCSASFIVPGSTGRVLRIDLCVRRCVNRTLGHIGFINCATYSWYSRVIGNIMKMNLFMIYFGHLVLLE